MVGGVKDNVMSILKTNTTNDYNNPIHANKVHGGQKKQRKLKIKKKLI